MPSATADDAPRGIPRQTWIVLATTILGWVVTSLDLQISAFVAPQVTSSLDISSNYLSNIFFVFSVGLAVGAFFLGYFSDLWIGRKNAFLYSIVGTIVLTGVTGLAQTGIELIVIRFFAGVFSGGEWVLGLAILAEVAPARRRSLMLGATQAGVGIGYGLANLFGTTFAAPGVTSLGWRLAYFASFAFAASTYIIRRKVEESPQWQELMRRPAGPRMKLADVRANTAQLFRGRQRHLTILAIVLFIVIGEPQGTWDFLYPSWYHHLHRHSLSGDSVTFAYEIALMAATIWGGWFMDRHSSRRLLPLVWIAVPFTLLIWLAPHASFFAQAAFLFCAGFGRQLSYALVAAYFPVLFPTRLRGTGMGVTWIGGWLLGYAASAGWGGSVQSGMGWNVWWMVQVGLLIIIPLPMIIAGVETRGRKLDFMQESTADPPAAGQPLAASVGRGQLR